MAKLVYVNDETNEENDDGSACTLYFDGKPTEAEVKAAIGQIDGKKFRSQLTPDVDDAFFGFNTYPNKVSKKAGLVRIQAWS